MTLSVDDPAVIKTEKESKKSVVLMKKSVGLKETSLVSPTKKGADIMKTRSIQPKKNNILSESVTEDARDTQDTNTEKEEEAVPTKSFLQKADETILSIGEVTGNGAVTAIHKTGEVGGKVINKIGEVGGKYAVVVMEKVRTMQNKS